MFFKKKDNVLEIFDTLLRESKIDICTKIVFQDYFINMIERFLINALEQESILLKNHKENARIIAPYLLFSMKPHKPEEYRISNTDNKYKCFIVSIALYICNQSNQTMNPIAPHISINDVSIDIDQNFIDIINKIVEYNGLKKEALFASKSSNTYRNYLNIINNAFSGILKGIIKIGDDEIIKNGIRIYKAGSTGLRNVAMSEIMMEKIKVSI